MRKRNRFAMILVASSVACFEPDPDSDQLLNKDESDLGTDPGNPDTDSDGILDGHEVHFYFTNPTVADSDGDGDSDGWEIQRGLDPLDELSHGYTGNWPMLTVEEKAELERDPQPESVTVGRRIKRTTAYDQHVEKFDLYDVALQERYTILLSDSASWGLGQWALSDFPGDLDGLPVEIRPWLADGAVGLVMVASDSVSDESIVSQVPRDAAAGASMLPGFALFPHLVDDSMELWAFLGRPEPDTTFYLLDDHMIVRAINDFDLMLDLIEAGHPPPAED